MVFSFSWTQSSCCVLVASYESGIGLASFLGIRLLRVVISKPGTVPFGRPLWRTLHPEVYTQIRKISIVVINNLHLLNV